MPDIELVIKIPEEIRSALINNIQLSPEQKSISDSYIIHAIIDGTLLDHVKAEIQRTITASWYNGENYKKNYRDGLNDAIKIIDSIGKTEESKGI